MTQQIINVGTTPGDSTGDAARMAFDKCNQNFTELYTTGAATATEGIWNFNQTSTDTTTAPASGRFRTNSGNAATATQFAIHRISINGFDRADTLRTQHPGDIIKLQDKANADSWARFVVQAIPVDNVDWFQINVAFDSGGGTAPGNNQEILFTFAASSGGGGGGGGNVSNVGTPTNGQLAQWTDATHIQGIASSSLGFASLASPVFTGDPQAPTPATADNDTSIATTAFVKAQSYLTGNQTVTLSGDIAGAGTTAITATIANNAVTNAKLADIATARLRGRVTAGTGDPEDLTGTQATTLLDVVTSSLKGLAPPSGGGTTNFLRADATWAAPPGGPVLLSKQTVSAAASVDFTSLLTSQFDEYEIHFWGVFSSTNADSLVVRIGESGIYTSTATYFYDGFLTTHAATNASQGGASSTGIVLVTSGVANAVTSQITGRLRIPNPAATNSAKQLFFDLSYFKSTSVRVSAFGGGGWFGDTNAIDSIRFLMATGTISGTFKLYGIP